ncbi:putative two component response regulator [Candidatus Kuenenia stuttgartiensis]|jgi:CheY-like chemotaxis protein|uniref:Putative two component response regulator n=1 Tax=Kuenenia stuttgartiensis TaxID=174633 RepID=Q1Q518_KUEST|nr:response regulator [Candidatus Kuenenia stuttgartiensis]MBE7547078.1 response regulator [Planctomycetia bacterium]MBZ0192601.1 response regulator [Candidatus Kuenenia stuttgartiensis]MCF6151720.1 response regulator [Candidatus Kuenenia stuttgartiensis]MCL4726514.1 response regulator [Candidatus Kuenenia stuttgartiensis]QII12493.1 putative two component response regulator [Candidatus Kuenenia stuttgartiensis]
MKTILVVEDDKNQRLWYKQELEREGYNVVTAGDGTDCIKMVDDYLPDIIVMDIVMPKMDGLESMGKILSEHRKIPVIINTAYSCYKASFLSWPADAYLTKSSDLKELKNTIRGILGENGGRI